MGISSTSGLMSGIDYGAIIEATLEVERQPMYSLQSKQSDYLAQISSYGSVKSSLSSLQSAMEKLSDPNEFITYSASSSNKDILTISTDEEAGTGTYSIVVQNLAKTEIINSYSGFTGTDQEIGTGTLSIAAGDGESTEITIDSENNTLEGIADAINNSNAEVSATIIKLGDDNYALSLTADSTGKAISFSVTGDEDGALNDESGLSRLYSDPLTGVMDIAQQAEQAMFTFNGLEIERSVNTIDDLITGVTINLVDSDPDSTITIEVKKKFTSMETCINEFVNAYNNVVSVFSDEQYFNPETGEAGVLFGDHSATMIKNGITNLLKTRVDGVSEEINSLSALGVELQGDGTLSFDSTKLNEVIGDKEEEVISFFTNVDENNKGFAVQLYDYLDAYTRSDGILDQKTDSYQDSVDAIDDEIEDKQRLLDIKEENLWEYYNSLELKLSELSSLQSAVSAMINSLNYAQNQ